MWKFMRREVEERRSYQPSPIAILRSLFQAIHTSTASLVRQNKMLFQGTIMTAHASECVQLILFWNINNKLE